MTAPDSYLKLETAGRCIFSIGFFFLFKLDLDFICHYYLISFLRVYYRMILSYLPPWRKYQEVNNIERGKVDCN